MRSPDRHHLGGCQKCKLSSSIPELLGVSNFYHPSELSRGLESKRIAGPHSLLISRYGPGDCRFAFLTNSWVMLKLLVQSNRVGLECWGSSLPSPAKDNRSCRRLVRSHRDSPPPGTEKSSPTNHRELPRDKQVFAECCLHLEQINFKQ